jgi:glycine cleavage system H protein
MANIPDDLQYTAEHEYVKRSGEPNVVVVGITDYAQGELGDIVFVELPEVGTSYQKMDVFGTIEAVKAVSELFSPVAGEIVAVNEALEANPALVNSDPYGDGWMLKLRISDPTELASLLDAERYRAQIEQAGRRLGDPFPLPPPGWAANPLTFAPFETCRSSPGTVIRASRSRQERERAWCSIPFSTTTPSRT